MKKPKKKPSVTIMHVRMTMEAEMRDAYEWSKR